VDDRSDNTAAAAGDLLILAVLCLLLYFWNLGAIPFYDRGEPREGLVVAEMATSGNWILPLVNGEYIPFKPPLFHWLATLAVKASGRLDEFTLRLPSALLGTLGIFLTYFAGTRLWGRPAGLIAAVILLSNVHWWIGATNVQVDMTLAFFLVAALLQFLFFYRADGAHALKAIGFAVLVACATLAKGPLGIVLPGLVVVVFLAVRRELVFLKKLQPWLIAAVFLVIAGSWYALAIWQGGAAFFLRQIVDENLRTATGAYGHPQPIYYFAPILMSNMAPWSFFFPALAVFLIGERRRLAELHLLFPTIWAAAIFVFFSLSSGKRGIYILALYPAVALLWGAWWSRLARRESGNDRLTLVFGYFVALTYLVALAAFYLQWLGWNVFRYLPKGQNSVRLPGLFFPPSTATIVAVLLATIASGGAFWALKRRRWNGVFVCFAVPSLVCVVLVKTVYYPAIASELTLKPFMQRVMISIDPARPLIFYRAFDAGAILYAHRHIRSYKQLAPQLQPPFYLLAWEEDWARLSGVEGFEFLQISEGTGPARMHRMVLIKANQLGASGVALR
jgi:hypothetical protein